MYLHCLQALLQGLLQCGQGQQVLLCLIVREGQGVESPNKERGGDACVTLMSRDCYGSAEENLFRMRVRREPSRDDQARRKEHEEEAEEEAEEGSETS
eukprot:130551-Hanusia_phi.AAC.1